MNTPEKIESYIEGKLSPQEKRNFEKEMENDGELAREVLQRKSLYKALSELLAYPTVEIKDDKNFKLTAQQNIRIEEDLLKFHQNESLSGLSDEEQNLKRVLEKTAKYNSVDKHHKLVLITKVAAGFAIMLLISFFFLYYTHTNSTVLNHYNFQSVCDIFPSENDLYLKNIVHSITLLRQGETNVTRDSAEHFVLKHGKEMEILKLSDAVTNLENSNLAQARTRLEKLITSDHQEVKISALWYYSLLCIKEEKESEALQIIRRLTKEKNYYSEKADSLINFIKRE